MDMNIFEILRAKSMDKEGNAKTLKEHIKDALDRVKKLYESISKINFEWETFSNKDKKEEFFKNLAKAIILHDFGKVDYKFQQQLFKKREEEDNSEWLKVETFFSNDAKKVHFHRHEILSSIYVSFLLDNTEWSKKVMTAILLHHYNNYFIDIPSLPVIIRDFEEDIEGYMKFISSKKKVFEESYNNLLDYLFQDFSNETFVNEAIKELKNSANWDNAENLFNSYLDDDLSGFVDFYEPKNKLSNDTKKLDKATYQFLVFLGALRRVDYSSSGDILIERNSPEGVLKFDELVKNFKEKFQTKILWQEEILKDKNSNKIKHLILVAPTGSGKTEFSILWAAKNPRKFLYTLPLRVALNDLFMRFKGNDKKGYFDKENVNILHSTAFIEYVKENEGQSLDTERKITSSKLLSYPLMLTTPDQIFLTSLNYYGSDKIISVYPTSSIVVDEIQTFNPEMAAIVVKTLRIIKHLGGNILVMTATLPPYFNEFLNDLCFEKLDISNYADKIEIKNYKRKRHCIEIIEKNLCEYREKGKTKSCNVEIKPEIKEYLKKKLKDKQNVLIVVNNVKKAISLYKYLENEWKKDRNDYKIFLLHSRLIEKYKTERIDEIKKGLKKNEKIIVVSTQLIEASVDFDFDFMLTELSTIDSQIQRWGRVYRKRNEDYEKKEVNIVVFVGKIENGELSIDQGTSYIYDKEVLESTRDILIKYQKQILSYEEEKRMVEETFNKKIGNKTLKDKYEEKIEETLKFLNYFSASKKSEAQRIFRRLAGFSAVVPALMKEDNKGWVRKLGEIIENGDNISWNEIENETGKNRWILKAEIYNYSVTVPEFAMGKYGWFLSSDFKGFKVLRVEKEVIDNIREYGLDDWFQELEDIEINERFY